MVNKQGIGKTHLDTHDGTDTTVALVECHHLGKRVGEADIRVNDKDLAWVSLEDCITEMIETTRCS